MENSNYIYGRNAVIEAISSGKTIEKIFIAFGTHGEVISRIYSLASKNKISIATSDRKKFQIMEKNNDIPAGKSQGVIALLREFETYNLNELIENSFDKTQKPIIVVLDGIEDPHNLGAIARTAECVNAAGIIIALKNSVPITPTAVKVSAGALEIIPVAKVSSISQTLDMLKKEGFWIVGTDMIAEKLYTDDIYNCPVAIVIGSEGKGLRPGTVKQCDHVVSIPLLGEINSLNASVSAGIILFEILRQRNFKN